MAVIGGKPNKKGTPTAPPTKKELGKDRSNNNAYNHRVHKREEVTSSRPAPKKEY